MKKDEHVSEERLNALIDGELDSEEGNALFSEAEQSAELDQRLCQQRKLKELVKHAKFNLPISKTKCLQDFEPVTCGDMKKTLTSITIKNCKQYPLQATLSKKLIDVLCLILAPLFILSIKICFCLEDCCDSTPFEKGRK